MKLTIQILLIMLLAGVLGAAVGCTLQLLNTCSIAYLLEGSLVCIGK